MPRPLQVDLRPFNLENGVRVTTSVLILVFLGISVLDLGPMYATQTDVRQTDVRRASSLNARPRGGGITNCMHVESTETKQ